jgi:hypothetical protein
MAIRVCLCYYGCCKVSASDCSVQCGYELTKLEVSLDEELEVCGVVRVCLSATRQILNSSTHFLCPAGSTNPLILGIDEGLIGTTATLKRYERPPKLDKAMVASC